MSKISELIANVRAAVDELEAAAGGEMNMEHESEGEELPSEGEEPPTEAAPDEQIDEESDMSGMRPKKKPDFSNYFATKGRK